MKKDSNKNIRDIKAEYKSIEQKKMTPFNIIMGLLIGSLLYFGYYILMTEYFKVDPIKFPYLLISIYLGIAVTLLPYANNKVSSWVEHRQFVDSFLISQVSIPFAYVFAPIIFIVEFF